MKLLLCLVILVALLHNINGFSMKMKAGTPFHKYQGLGNDFILVDNTKSSSPMLTAADAVKYCNRNFGVGGDGLIFVMPGQNDCDYTMLIYNSDGTQPQMCGNGIRCMARYIHEVVEKQPAGTEVTYKIWTDAGEIVPVRRRGGAHIGSIGSPPDQVGDIQ